MPRFHNIYPNIIAAMALLVMQYRFYNNVITFFGNFYRLYIQKNSDIAMETTRTNNLTRNITAYEMPLANVYSTFRLP